MLTCIHQQEMQLLVLAGKCQWLVKILHPAQRLYIVASHWGKMLHFQSLLGAVLVCRHRRASEVALPAL